MKALKRGERVRRPAARGSSLLIGALTVAALLSGGLGSGLLDFGVAGQTAYRDKVLATAGLVAYWELNEASGTLAADSKGANPGTHAAGVTAGALPLVSAGRSADYNGAGGHTSVNSASALNQTASISLEAWIRPDTLPPSSATTYTIIRKDAQYLLRVLSNGALVFRVWVGGVAQEAVTPAGTISAGKTYHIAATYNRTNQKVYVNGVSKVSRAQTGYLDASANPLLLGASSSGGVYDYFDGRIDEVAVYRVALSATNITTHYHAGTDTTPPETTISSAPPASTPDTSASFSFTSSEAGSTFQCRLDGSAYSSCTSPKTYTNLAQGAHTFNVRAVDRAGNTDPTPAAHNWTVAAAPQCLPAFGSFAAGNWPPACWRPYADNTPFNQLIPANPTLVSNSAQIVARLNSWSHQGQTGPGDLRAGIADTAQDYDHPTYYSRVTDPVYIVRCTTVEWGTCEVEGLPVRIPSAARAAGGDDGHMTVVDQQNFWEYDFWQVDKQRSQPLPPNGGDIYISWGGRTRIGTADSDGLGSDATAAHFGNLAGIIRARELEAGQINHALFMVVRCDNGTYVPPAAGLGQACAEIGESNTDAPAEGQRFQLNMTDAEINALPVPSWKKTILRAMAHYGLYVGDTGGTPWDVEFESASTYTSFSYPDPFVTFAQNHMSEGGIYYSSSEGIYYFNMRNDVPWNRLRVIHPCVLDNSCGP